MVKNHNYKIQITAIMMIVTLSLGTTQLGFANSSGTNLIANLGDGVVMYEENDKDERKIVVKVTNQAPGAKCIAFAGTSGQGIPGIHWQSSQTYANAVVVDANGKATIKDDNKSDPQNIESLSEDDYIIVNCVLIPRQSWNVLRSTFVAN